jgi:hypothetical protein
MGLACGVGVVSYFRIPTKIRSYLPGPKILFGDLINTRITTLVH